MKIKSFAKENRPRERLKEKGSEALSDAELLALIIRTGTKKSNVIDVSQNLLMKYNLQSLSRINLESLSKIDGIGEAKACQIVACFELARRTLSKKLKKDQINSAKDIAKQYIPKFAYEKKEKMIGIYLDTRRRVIKEIELFVGNLDTTIIDPKEIFHHAIDENAAGVILLHNHPSGDSTPSEEDIKITNDLMKAAELLNINFLDHIIIGDKNYTSFREKKLIQ